jgi:hypothetical protein
MLDRFDDRTLEIATVIVVILIALVILCYVAILINPQVIFNPFKPPTPTLIAEATSSLIEATWTPTPTATPTNTSTPTPTWTPTPTPSDTPTPTPTSTDTATPVPTSTDTPVPTATRRPPPPKPTATPTPFPYYYRLAQGGPDCTRTWVWGYVVGANGLGEPGVQMRVGSDQGLRVDVWTDDNGRYEYTFASSPVGGTFFVRVFKGGVARSDQFWFQSGGGCTGPYSKQQFRIDWQRR